MRNLHEKLMMESGWYNAWHTHRGHGLAHWFLFLFVALLITSAVSEGINKNYLGNNLNLAAAVVVSKPTVANKASRPINDQYIIVFKDDVKDPKGLASQLTKEHNGQLLFAYDKAIKGFAAKIPSVAINGLKKNPNVKYVEQDQTVQATATMVPASWGQDRIDQSPLPLDNIYTYNYTGAGVNAYVIDTGIRSTHSQFTGRIGNGVNFIADSYGTDGCHWHGTHVAGTIGGTTVGVAKGITLHSVRVLDCNGSGSTAGVIAGVDWVTNNKMLPAVANMSVSGGKSDALNTAVKNSIATGITYAVAAGNAASDACQYSPASEASALTVGATTIADGQASYSDYGTCVDLLAPGSSIYSAWNTDDYSMGSANGTSMATPHVAGVAALYLQQNPTATPSQVTNAIMTGSTKGALILGTTAIASPNLLLNSLFNGTTVTPPIVDTQPPSTPANLSAALSADRKVVLTWTPSTDNVAVGGYTIMRNGISLGTVAAGANPMTYTDLSVTNGSTYSYYVFAYDTPAGNSSQNSNTVSITIGSGATPPPPPTGTPVDIISYSVLNILSTSATIKWQTNVAAHGTLVIKTRKESPRTFTLSADSTNQYVYPIGLKPNTSYSYTITATDGSTTDTVNGTFKTRRN